MAGLSGLDKFSISSSTNILQAGDTNISLDSASDTRFYPSSYMKFGKRHTINYSGNIRVKFDANNTDGTGGHAVVYKNGVQAGTIRTVTSANPAAPNTFIEDFPCNIGDYFEIFGQSPASYNMTITNTRICASVSPLVTQT